MGKTKALLRFRPEPGPSSMNVALQGAFYQSSDLSLHPPRETITVLPPTMTSSGGTLGKWLQPGVRVALQFAPTSVTLRSRTGVIVRQDEFDDYFIVRLDLPARYRHAGGEIEELSEIAVMTDNLMVFGI